MVNSALTSARVLMGDSLGFHIVFVLFGLALPVLVSWFEFMAIRRGDPKLLNIAKSWSKIMALLVITGVISGTIIALQMSLVWPGILQFGGKVIGLPFMFETYAFLIEATFLAIYLATWNNKRVGKWVHWTLGLGIIIGSTLSAYAITSINGWMNNPTGFTYVQGKLTNISYTQAMFSRVAMVEFLHSMPGYYLAAALAICGIYAFKLLRTKLKNRSDSKHTYDWLVIQKLMIFIAIMFVFSALTADLTGKYLAKYEPVKLAAIELNYNNRAHAPLLIGGVGTPQQTIRAPHFEIPDALSVLAGNSPNTVVQGLNDFAPDKRPPLYVHTLFDIKMTIITVFVVLILIYFAIRLWRPQWLKRTPVLLALLVFAPFGIILVELGWMMTEIGRQPWAVRNYVLTQDALTKTHNIASFGYFFPLSYAALFVVTVMAALKLARSNTGGHKS